MRKKLYELLDTSTKQRTPYNYNTLRSARHDRRTHNQSANDPLRFIVVPGPDHPKYVKP